MGRISEELKAINKKAAEKAPKVEKPAPYYYIERVQKGGTARAGWLYSSYKRSLLTSELIKSVIEQFKDGKRILEPKRLCIYSSEWFLYPGPKPDPRWGPVSP